MLNNKLTAIIFSILITFSGFAAAADLPTISQVYAVAHAGKLDEAQQMINQVLQAHPNSSKAHYVASELLAKQGKIANAREEFKTAEKLDPGLSYAKPEAVNELKAILSPAQSSSQPSQSQSAPSGFPWGLLILGIGAILIITLIIRAFTARNAPVVYPNGYQPNTVNPMTGQPYPGGYAQPTGGGMGSGIMGGLATGAAIGAGMVAGEALAHHFTDGNSNSTNGVNPVSDSWADSNINPNDNMGGNDFGIADNSSWDDSSDISGGDDWT
ncbi:MAG: tetratricopeptide repeat protein [Methylophilaceae bacterium]|nr:tetratricopeptide repeat protein [Methyloradius sp.]